MHDLCKCGMTGLQVVLKDSLNVQSALASIVDISVRVSSIISTAGNVLSLNYRERKRKEK